MTDEMSDPMNPNSEPSLQERVASLRHTERECIDRLSEVREQIRDLELQHATATTGVSIGSVVEWRGKQYRVTKIDPFCGTVLLKGNIQKKDGLWGAAEHNLYDYWTLVE